MLKEKVKELVQRCKVLTVENETLKAELEMYRSEVGGNESTAAGGGSKGSTLEGVPTSSSTFQDMEHFIKYGDGTRVKEKAALLEKLHGGSNQLCCSLSNDDTILATGSRSKPFPSTMGSCIGREGSHR